MQYLSRNLHTRDQFVINKRARSRKMSVVSILTVHNDEKQECQYPKLEKMFGEGVKVKKNNGNVMRILQQMPSIDSNILKNMKYKLNMNLKQSDGYDTCYKTHNRTISNRPLTNFRKISNQSANYNQIRNTSIKRLMNKLSNNKMKPNYGCFLMGKEDLADPKTILNRRKHLEYENLSKSLSCKLVPYNDSNLLSKYTVRKILINNPSETNTSKNNCKKQQYLTRYRQNRRMKTDLEEELTGWQINMENKQSNSINFCSLQPIQL